MPVNLSVKNVPDPLAERLRLRADRNRRSLQKELLSILEAAALEGASAAAPARGRAPSDLPPRTIESIAARARELFPVGTDSSVAYIRELRDNR
jgi:plasmid stability protein